MRATTVRFSEHLWQRLEVVASAQGVSAAQLVRDAAIMRISGLVAPQGDAEAETLSSALSAPGAGDKDDVRSKCSDPRRLEAVRATGLLKSGSDPALNRLADTARRIMNAPVGLITVVDEDRQVLKASIGLKEPLASRGETPLSHSYCRFAVASGEVLRVEDAREDPRFMHSPGLEAFDAVAYLGAPLTTQEGHVLGNLCVIDHRPRLWTSDQVETIETLAAAVVDHVRAAKSKGQPTGERFQSAG